MRGEGGAHLAHLNYALRAQTPRPRPFLIANVVSNRILSGLPIWVPGRLHFLLHFLAVHPWGSFATSGVCIHPNLARTPLGTRICVPETRSCAMTFGVHRRIDSCKEVVGD